MDHFGDSYRFIPYIPNTKRKSKWLNEISSIVNLYNQDNITRTSAYQKFYLLHPEIKWSFLASMVSRNAGWNMTDLKGSIFPMLIKANTIENLFLTYERANWSIFQDAFPQLLLYHYSTIYKEKMFHLLKEFNVSSFMEKEWNMFWETGNELRLVQALIINEQNLIQKPVIEHPVYKKKVFGTSLFFIEEHLHFCSVLFPTMKGELFGGSVQEFREVDKRIELGNVLFHILFHSEYYPSFLNFALNVVHTGSRRDYERFCLNVPCSRTPSLQTVYAKVEHNWNVRDDWSSNKKIEEAWFKEPLLPKEMNVTEWFFHKRKQLEWVVGLKKKYSNLKKKLF